MNIVVYETDQDRHKELGVASILSNAWSCELNKLPKFDKFDFVAARDGIVSAFIEIKCRENERLSYPTVILSASKLQNAQAMHLACGLPCLFVVRWVDAIGYTSMLEQYPMTIVPRTDGQQEPAAHIPIEKFTLL